MTRNHVFVVAIRTNSQTGVGGVVVVVASGAVLSDDAFGGRLFTSLAFGGTGLADIGDRGIDELASWTCDSADSVTNGFVVDSGAGVSSTGLAIRSGRSSASSTTVSTGKANFICGILIFSIRADL